MHQEHEIPIKMLEPGTGSAPNPVRVMAPQPIPFFQLWACLFRIEYGRDGSLYIKPTPKAGEYETARAKPDASGVLTFNHDDFQPVGRATASRHPYISFHSRNSEINHPGRQQGDPFDQRLPFRIGRDLDEYRTLCWQTIGPPGIYYPESAPEQIDCVFDSFAGYPLDRKVPIFIIDVAPFDGDPDKILEIAGRDTDVSVGYLLTDEHGQNPWQFLRVRLAFGDLSPDAKFPEGHQITYVVE